MSNRDRVNRVNENQMEKKNTTNAQFDKRDINLFQLSVEIIKTTLNLDDSRVGGLQTTTFGLLLLFLFFDDNLFVSLGVISVISGTFSVGKASTHSSNGAPAVASIKAWLARLPLLEVNA